MASIKQQNNGKWRYRIRYKDNGKFKEVSKSGFRTKREAQAAANDFEKRINTGKSIHDENMLVSHYMETWLKLKEKHVKSSTMMKINRSVRLYILPKFGFSKLSEINRLDCIEWINELCETLSVDSVKSYVAPFNTALEDAVNEFKIIETNPMKNIRYPKSDRRKKEISFYEKTDLKKLLNCFESQSCDSNYIGYQYYVLTLLLARTGLRLGEALALSWNDIQRNKLEINKTLSRENGVDLITTPKTDSSYRTIALDTMTTDLLRSFKIKKSEYALANSISILNKQLVFSSTYGEPLKQQNYRSYFYRMCNLADVPKLSPHALRHSHAVHLLESGSNIKYVSERLGHATINMTANVYLHVSQKMETEAIAMYERYF